MIEIPEAATLAHQLEAMITGQTITAAVAGQSPHGFAWYSHEAAQMGPALVGLGLEGARARGGRAELLLSGAQRLSLFDGVNVRHLPPGAARPKKHQLLIELSDGSALAATVQMYGGIMLYPVDERINFYDAVADTKPNPLEDDFDEAHFQGLISAGKPSLSAKALLATEQRIPGLGNGCCHDILFAAGVNPQSHVGRLGDARQEALYHSVKEVLFEMTRRGGRDTEKDLNGSPGGYRTVLGAKTRGLPCPRCGGEILRKAYLGGNVYFCPNCQPVLK